MIHPKASLTGRLAAYAGFVVALGASLSACTAPEERRQANVHQDIATCTEFGATPGSTAYTDCMLAQQSRRDKSKREALEQAALATKMSKDSQEISRKVQCDKEARKDRDAGRQPRRCG